MNPALLYAYYGRRRGPCKVREAQASIFDPEYSKVGVPVPLNEARQGTVAGAWLIPHGDEYLKLKIFTTYDMRNTLHWLPLIGKTKSVSNWFGDRLLPIWALVQSEDILKRTFPWFKEAAKANLDCLSNMSTTEEDAERHAAALVGTCLRNGWGFWMLDGSEGYFGSASNSRKPRWFSKFLEELQGQATTVPNNVVLHVDETSIASVNCIDENNHVSMSWQKFIGAANRAGVKKAGSERIQSFNDLTHQWPHSVEDLEKFNAADLATTMSVQNFQSAWTAHKDKASRKSLRSLAILWIKYMRQEYKPDQQKDVDDFINAASRFMGLLGESVEEGEEDEEDEEEDPMSKYLPGQDPEDYEGSAPKVDWMASDNPVPYWSRNTVAKFLGIKPDRFIYQSMVDLCDLDPKLVEKEEAARIRKMGEQEVRDEFPNEFLEEDPDDEDAPVINWIEVREQKAQEEEANWECSRQEFNMRPRGGFPPIVLTRTNCEMPKPGGYQRNTFEVNDGNHRTEVWQEQGFSVAPAWVNDEWLRNQVASGAIKESKQTLLSESVKLLSEMTFRALQQSTLTNGQYKFGGMRRVGGVWIYDITVPDRAQNSRFVIRRIPKLSVDQKDGCPRLDYAFRSRPDRSTTGRTHLGYIKFIPKYRKFQPTAKDLKKTSWRWAQGKNPLDMDVHVSCGCEDFKYRWHYALSRRNASHMPTGGGNDATNAPPVKTNPTQKPCLCKHLYAMGEFVGKVNLSGVEPKKSGLDPQGDRKPAKVRKNAKVKTKDETK